MFTRFLIPLICLTIVAANAQGTVLSSFNPERNDRFACQVSTQINQYLIKNGQSYESVMKAIEADLQNEISTWASAVSFDQPIIGTSKVLYSDYDYFLQNAFINLGKIDVASLVDQNYFGAYAFLSAKRETQFRLGEIKGYNLSSEANLIDQINEYVPATQGLKWPRYEDANGELKSAIYNCRHEWKYGEICSSASTSPPGNPSHPSYTKWIKVAQSANLIASPLFMWIVAQPNQSITYEQLFERAVTQYQNPFLALGVITWMLMVDADMGSRTRGAVLSKRLRPIIYSSDQPGLHYHFWGFLLKSLYGEGLKYRIMSFIHERVVQGDTPDWLIDDMAISFGQSIIKRLREPSLCSR